MTFTTNTALSQASNDDTNSVHELSSIYQRQAFYCIPARIGKDNLKAWWCWYSRIHCYKQNWAF